MNETDEYILDNIRTWVWSGFYDAGEVNEMIDDLLEEDANEEMLRAAVPGEFAKKAEAETTWPAETDCDRLDRAFERLLGDGQILCLRNAGYTMSDGLDDVGEIFHTEGSSGYIGYCFYHGQDVERAVKGGGLYLAFGPVDDDDRRKLEVGRAVKQALELHGFRAVWNEDPEQRILIPEFDWKRRSSASPSD